MTLFCNHEDNRVLGFYDDEIHKKIPTPNFEVTEREIVECVKDHNTHFTREDGVLRFYKEVVTQTLEQRQEVIRQLRNRLYKEFADELYLEWQFDRSDESEAAWRAAVQKIKDEHPIPTE